jgi:hypothetical protein
VTADTEPDLAARFTAIVRDLNRRLPSVMAQIERHYPGPLCIDGREYHRRQMARRRRKRRGR